MVNADESYHITAKTVLSLAQRAEQIFDSSEVAEKRQLLEMVLQNPEVKGKNLEFTIRKPFDLMAEVKGYPSMLEWRDAFRSFDWANLYPNPRHHLEQINRLLAIK